MRMLTRCLNLLATKSGYLYAAEALVCHPPCTPRQYYNKSVKEVLGVDTFLRRRYSVSTMAAVAEPPLQQRKTEQSEARQRFLNVYHEIREEVLADPMLVQKDASEWMARMLDHNVPGGKLNRGMAVKETLMLIKPDASEELQKQADLVGWSIEFLQAYFLVADDIMDKSITRRGQPCWYRAEGVGLIAINDGILLECLLYYILRKHLRSHAAYPHLLDLFLETTHQTAHGQLLDLITAPVGVPDLTRFSLERYMDIVTFKTAYYSFYLPVACGLHLAGITDAQAFSDAKAILIKMGQYFQIQDDYLDCFADPEVLGKIGTDIQDNKCSWLVCTALQQATAEQKEIIVQNYGQDDETRIAAIKTLFREMELQSKFQQLESTSYAELTAMIEAQTSVPRAVYDQFLAKIYKRQK